jgi:predicted AlkP superfamily phosphohydrolase/phosphomutase
VSWKHLRRNIYPSQFYDELKSIDGFNARELAWDFDMEKKASKGVPESDYQGWLEFHIRREKQWFEVVRYLMKKDRADLTAVVFDGPDKISHIGWRFLDPQFFSETPSAWEKKIRDLCLEYFRRLDDFLAEIVQLAGPETRFFMASDHGFSPSHYVFRVNAWLHQQGYLSWKEHEGLDEKSRQSIQRLVDNHFVDLDWNKTLAYARTTTSNGIYIRAARPEGRGGVAVDEYESFRNQLIEKLLAVTHPDTGERIVRHVFTKEEAYPGKNNHQAPDLTLVMSDYSFLSIINKSPVVCARPEVEGTHHPAGIFIANGPGIHQARTLAPIPIIDISPILLYSLGLDIPADMEGRLPERIFEDAYMAKHPYRRGKETQAPESYALRTPRETAREDDEEIYKRLKMLGYLE